MQKALARYLQVTGMILGSLLLIVAALVVLTRSRRERELVKYDDERDRIGWIGPRSGETKMTEMGVLVDGETVLTAAHVASKSGELYFSRLGYSPVLLGEQERDQERDLVWIRVTSQPLQTIVRVAQLLESGEEVYVWIYQDEEWQKVKGTVMDTAWPIQLQQAWGEVLTSQTQAVRIKMENNLGDSGMPVWNNRGELVGVLVGVDLEDLNVSYVMRVEERL